MNPVISIGTVCHSNKHFVNTNPTTWVLDENNMEFGGQYLKNLYDIHMALLSLFRVRSSQ